MQNIINGIHQQIYMSSTMRQVHLGKVSLELNSCTNTSHPDSQNNRQNRASLCYSANLKRRTDALNAQRQGIFQCIQKGSPSNQKLKNGSSNPSPAFYPQKKLKHLHSGSKSIYHKNEPIQTFKNIQTIKISAKGFFKTQRVNQQKKAKKQYLQNYGTTTTRMFNQQKNQQINSSQFIQTCPDFKQNQCDKQQTNKCLKRSQKYSKMKTQQGIHKNNKSQTMPKQVENTKRSIFRQKEYCKKRNTQNIIGNKQTFNQIRGISKKQLTHPVNRLQSDTNEQMKETKSTKQSNFFHNIPKQIYRTNFINLSDHFTSSHIQKGVFPVCKKMTMSTINKYYQLCVEQIKTKCIQKKYHHAQNQIKNRISLNNHQQAADRSKTMQLKQQLINLQKFAKTFQLTKQSDDRIQRPVEQQHSQKTNIHIEQSVYKYNQNPSIKQNYNSNFQKQKLIQFVDQKQIRPITVAKILRYQRPEARHHIRSAVKPMATQEAIELCSIQCSKKQLIDRVSMIDPMRKSFFNQPKENIKKSYTDFQRQQNHEQILNQGKYKLTSKLIRAHSMSSPKKIARKLIQQPALDAWDQQNNNEQNFHNNQFNIEQIN